MAHNSHIVGAKENLKLSHGESPATDTYQTPTHRLKLYISAIIESESCN